MQNWTALVRKKDCLVKCCEVDAASARHGAVCVLVAGAQPSVGVCAAKNKKKKEMQTLTRVQWLVAASQREAVGRQVLMISPLA